MLSPLDINSVCKENGHQQVRSRRRSWLARRRCGACIGKHEEDTEVYVEPIGSKRSRILRFFQLSSHREVRDVQVSCPENGSKSQCSTASPFTQPQCDDVTVPSLVTSCSDRRLSGLEDDDTTNTIDEVFGALNPEQKHNVTEVGVQCDDVEWRRKIDELEQSQRIVLSQLCDKLGIDVRHRPQSLDQYSEPAAGSYEAQRRILNYQRDFLDLMHQAAKRISDADLLSYEDARSYHDPAAASHDARSSPQARSSCHDSSAYHDVLEYESEAPAESDGIPNLHLSLPLEMSRTLMRSDTPDFDEDLMDSPTVREEDAEAHSRERMDVENQEQENDEQILCPRCCASMEPETTMLYLIQNESHKKAFQEVTFVVPADLVPGTDVRFTHGGTTYRVTLGPDHLPGTTVHVRVGKPPPLNARERKEIHDFVRIAGEVMQMVKDGTKDFLQNPVSQKRLQAYRAIQGQSMQPLMDDIAEEEEDGGHGSEGEKTGTEEKATTGNDSASEELSGSELSTYSQSNRPSSSSSSRSRSREHRVHGSLEREGEWGAGPGTRGQSSSRDPSPCSSVMSGPGSDNEEEEDKVFMPPQLALPSSFPHGVVDQECIRLEQDADDALHISRTLSDFDNLDLSLPSKHSGGSKEEQEAPVVAGLLPKMPSSHAQSSCSSDGERSTSAHGTKEVSMRYTPREDDEGREASASSSSVLSSSCSVSDRMANKSTRVRSGGFMRRSAQQQQQQLNPEDGVQRAATAARNDERDTLGPLFLTRKHSSKSSSVLSTSNSQRSDSRKSSILSAPSCSSHDNGGSNKWRCISR